MCYFLIYRNGYSYQIINILPTVITNSHHSLSLKQLLFFKPVKFIDKSNHQFIIQKSVYVCIYCVRSHILINVGMRMSDIRSFEYEKVIRSGILFSSEGRYVCFWSEAISHECECNNLKAHDHSVRNSRRMFSVVQRFQYITLLLF